MSMLSSLDAEIKMYEFYLRNTKNLKDRVEIQNEINLLYESMNTIVEEAEREYYEEYCLVFEDDIAV